MATSEPNLQEKHPEKPHIGGPKRWTNQAKSSCLQSWAKVVWGTGHAVHLPREAPNSSAHLQFDVAPVTSAQHRRFVTDLLQLQQASRKWSKSSWPSAQGCTALSALETNNAFDYNVRNISNIVTWFKNVQSAHWKSGNDFGNVLSSVFAPQRGWPGALHATVLGSCSDPPISSARPVQSRMFSVSWLQHGSAWCFC